MLTSTLQPVCDGFATKKNWNRPAVAKVAERFSWSCQPVANWNQSWAVFWTCTKDWIRSRRGFIGGQMIADWSTIGRRLKCRFELSTTNCRLVGDRSVSMSHVFNHDIQHLVCLAICIEKFWRPVESVTDWSLISFTWLQTCRRVYGVSTATSHRQVTDQSQTSCKPVAD